MLLVCLYVCLFNFDILWPIQLKFGTQVTIKLEVKLSIAKGVQLLRSNPWEQDGVKYHMLSYGQKCFIVYFDNGIKLDQILSKDHMSINVITCQLMSIHVISRHVKSLFHHISHSSPCFLRVLTRLVIFNFTRTT